MPLWCFKDEYGTRGMLYLYLGNGRNFAVMVRWGEGWTWEQKGQAIAAAAESLINDLLMQFDSLRPLLKGL